MTVRGGGGAGEDRVRLLSLVDVFEPLSREEIDKINWQNLNTRLEPGEVFYTPMDLCETLFVLQSGRVRIYRALPEGRELTLAVLESGTVFGEMALTGQRLRASYAQAMEESEISAMCRNDVERLVLDKPAVGLQLVHLLSERLAAYETRMEGLGLKEVPARLAGLILELVETQGIRDSAGYRIPTRYTHQQLGTMIGANREAVTRAFARLRETGAVEVRRRYVHVEDLEALKVAAAGTVPE
ncbi:cyclic nucleotide-binding domain-containing protein [Rubrobacter tropicus]|uniref:Cyclic nucleotide-binding domain-containing protein n=1 Tax=Rubrobacter tropicus TaxID=2653851 RepID=A0A6G8QCQ9_9ACTN|nr:Crp/Fnr family transcriptional regulator [Rubrobacter tropicus]QIN84269.1 cyclic nucleotide-binding domain-containing protein [Rubrobacter tropicus]